MQSKRRLLIGTVVVASITGATVSALGAEVNFAGSVQLDYLLVPTDSLARDFVFDGFTTELSLKISADINEHISAQVKTCYGCHGFEMGAAYVDFRANDELTLRAGRFVPSFGDFQARHDPANHLTSDKPLIYDMGRMLHRTEWNMSILPAPYVDSGVQISWTPEVCDELDFEVSGYVVGGLRGSENAQDVDFIQSRSGDFYYIDNNSSPTVGGRVAVRWSPGDLLIAGGVSGLYGTYDPRNKLDLWVLGADLVLRIDRIALRFEYMARRTKMDLGADPSSAFRYGPGADGVFDPYQLKQGFYGELTLPAGDILELVARVDGMRRQGNVVLASPLRSDSAILRYTAGMNVTLARDWRIKLSGEFYDFSDFSDEVGLHLGVVGAF